MRILAHIHTLNDEAVIERSLEAVLAQTRPIDGVVIVDNGSTDGTLNRAFPDNVTIIRHGENLGTSGAVHSGMTFARDRGYEWIWLFDADSAPRPHALETLLSFYGRLPDAVKGRVWLVASLPYDLSNRCENHGSRLTSAGFQPVDPPLDGQPYECVSTIWSGSLYRMDIVREVGLPSPDYVLDWGESAYGYEGHRRGYKAFMVPRSVVDHNIDTERGSGGVHRTVRIGPFRFLILDLPPIRYYYLMRNLIYLWLYVLPRGGRGHLVRIVLALKWILKYIVVFTLLGRWKDTGVILRAVLDGALGRMGRRYRPAG